MTKDISPLHWLLDFEFSMDRVLEHLEGGADPNTRVGPFEETALHVAVRRRRVEMVGPLLDAGAEIDALTAGGKTAWVHAYRRGFNEVTEALAQRGANCKPNGADDLAEALMRDDVAAAAGMLRDDPSLARGAGPEEARALPDITGYDRVAGMKLLLDHDAPIDARGLDGGTALHQAAWFGAAQAVALLIERGAALEIRGDRYELPPLGWACHGSRYSGGASERSQVYAEIAQGLLFAGASFQPERDRDMLKDASVAVRRVLKEHDSDGTRE